MTTGFIQRELAHIESALHDAPVDSERYRQLYIAQQALGWALEPAGFMSPLGVIEGRPGDSTSIPPE